jgi:hypothetical protein
MNEIVQFKFALHKHLHAHTLHSTDEYLNALNDSQFKERILFLQVDCYHNTICT